MAEKSERGHMKYGLMPDPIAGGGQSPLKGLGKGSAMENTHFKRNSAIFETSRFVTRLGGTSDGSRKSSRDWTPAYAAGHNGNQSEGGSYAVPGRSSGKAVQPLNDQDLRNF